MCWDTIRTSHTWNSTHVLTNWTTVVSYCRLPESGAVRHQSKTQRQTLAERYENSVFRLTPLHCNLPRGRYCWQVLRQIAVIDLFAGSKHRRRIQLLRRSLVRMLCHMVHMASCMRGMVDEPLQHACTPLYPAPPHVPNHSTTIPALARSTSIDFRPRSGPLFSMFGRSLSRNRFHFCYSSIHDLL